MIKLSIFYDGNPVSEFEQATGDKEITIGRAAGCAVHLDEPSISRLHALIRAENGGWVLERKASFGAVLLNGQEVENAPLEGGEEITLGKFIVRVQIEGGGEKSSGAGPGRPPREFEQEVEQEEGKTSFISTGVNGLFRFEPGSANLSEFLMQNDHAVFGRGSNCDVVLTEKKASRKHCEIRRQGLSFFLKDLNSANGTMVNGTVVSEVELVPGDVIQIGESRMQFSIENKDYFQKQDDFLPVPTHMEENDLVPHSGAAFPSAGGFDPNVGLGGMGQSGSQPDQFSGGGIPGINSGVGEEPEPQSLVGKLRHRYMKMSLRQRIIFIGIAFAFLTALLGGPDEPPKKPTIRSGKMVRTIDILSPDKKKFVISSYAELLKVYEKRDFQKMLEFTSKILTYVDEYKDTKSYESIAKKGLEEIEEARKAKELRERQEKIRAEVKELEEKGKEMFQKALKDAKYRPELDVLIQAIYSKDPNNQLAADWKVKIREREEEEKQEAEIARAKELLKQKAEEAYDAVVAIYKQDKYIEAINAADKLGDVGYSEQEYLDKVDSLKKEIEGKLSSIIDPLLKEAAAQRQEGGDLVKAKELYLQVLKVHSSNSDARSGIEAIKETLHLRAKRYYTEAIIAENLSDLVEAKEKYEKCFKNAPDDDIYKKRCRNKLARFEAFNSSESGGEN